MYLAWMLKDLQKKIVIVVGAGNYMTGFTVIDENGHARDRLITRAQGEQNTHPQICQNVHFKSQSESKLIFVGGLRGVRFKKSTFSGPTPNLATCLAGSAE